MPIESGNSVPGIRSDRTYTPRVVLWNDTNAQYLPGGKVVDSAVSRDALNTNDTSTLRPGMLMGKKTSGSKYAPSIIGVVASAVASGATTITVSAAVATEWARRLTAAGTFKITGPPTAAGTVATNTVTHTAVNTTTGVVTTSATAAAFVAGSFIQPTDGSETPKGILDEFVRVTDGDGNNIDGAMSRLLISGNVYSASIINYPSDTSLQAQIKTWLNAPSTGPGAFRFDDNF